MNKELLIKLIAATLASPPIMRMLAWADKKSSETGPAISSTAPTGFKLSPRSSRCRTTSSRKISLKVLGTRHCFNNIADSKDQFLSLKPMDNVIAIDPRSSHRHRRCGYHLWAVMPVSGWQGICVAQPRFAAPYLGRRSIQHRNPRLWREERQPGNRSLRPRNSHCGWRVVNLSRKRDREFSAERWSGWAPWA